MKNIEMSTLILEEMGVKKVYQYFFDPENLYGHNRLPLSITAEFGT